MIVITGFGRTGTSFFASWLRELGLIEYPHGYTPEVNAGIEPLDIAELNNKLVRKEPVAVEEIKKFSYPVIKDPRFLYEDVLDAWLSVRKDLRFLVLHRDLSDIRASRKAFQDTLKGSPDSYLLTEEQLATQLGKFMHLCIKNNLQVEYLYYPDFLDNYREAYEKLGNLGLYVSFDQGRDAWNMLVDKSKIHHGKI